MTWALLMKSDPEKYARKVKNVEAVFGTFNEQFPLDRLTRARRGLETSQENSAKNQELW